MTEKKSTGIMILLVTFFLFTSFLYMACKSEKSSGEEDGIFINAYKQEIPATRFIGKKGYTWDDWFSNGWFWELFEFVTEDFRKEYEDYGAFLGLYKFEKDGSYEYYIGMLLPEDTIVPKDYEYIDFPESSLGVAWAYGSLAKVHTMTLLAKKHLEKEGFEIITEEDGAFWCIERCAYPRYTDPDEKGNIIIDYCYFVE